MREVLQKEADLQEIVQLVGKVAPAPDPTALTLILPLDAREVFSAVRNTLDSRNGCLKKCCGDSSQAGHAKLSDKPCVQLTLKSVTSVICC